MSILHAIGSPLGIIALIIFVVAYALVICEEFIKLSKSKPVILASGLIWICVASIAHQYNLSNDAQLAIKSNIQEFGELFLFLLVAMTYVNVMQERKIFESLRVWLVNKGFNLHQLFWITGILAFFISPFVDNLTTALIMCAVVMAVGKNNGKFIGLACINIVVAANAGGVFSPFGDITSLMFWQASKIETTNFIYTFLPSAVSFLIPAAVMSIFVTRDAPNVSTEDIKISYGAGMIITLFALTIVTAVLFKVCLDLPPVIGMMMGLSYLQFYSYYLNMQKKMLSEVSPSEHFAFDILKMIENVEWDTLLFFYGIVLCVGGLATIGYLEFLSQLLYQDFTLNLPIAYQATPTNILLGIISAIFGNIPLAYSVLSMDPIMSQGQWLLITLTTGIGGSILSIGSAAGVALMGQARQHYTFFTHLKWTPVILLGYAAGIAAHLWLNRDLF